MTPSSEPPTDNIKWWFNDIFNSSTIKKLIYKADYTGWYCTFDERFWTEKDVADGLCPDCKRPIERLSEHNYFFKMGQYQERLIDHIPEQRRLSSARTSRRNEVLGFLQTQKLGDLSISRPKSRLSWGIELPFDKDYVTYVWFDALVNYISALEYLPRRNRAVGPTSGPRMFISSARTSSRPTRSIGPPC